MTPRFRIIAGPNGSGKTTLHRLLTGAYAVNFYTFLNADDMLAEARANGTLRVPLPIEGAALEDKLAVSTFPDSALCPFHDGRIVLKDGFVRFADPSAITSYTISFVANFIRELMVEAGQSCSQETVFSHPGKIDAFRKARERGFRTYLYFVATETPALNLFRVKAREAKGGHGVPAAKIISRYHRCLENAAAALPHLDRAYFFDDSGLAMRYLAGYSATDGFSLKAPGDTLPEWFRKHIPFDGGKAEE